MKVPVKRFLLVIGVIVCGYVIFMAGKYSFLITEPEALLTKQETWFVQKAREYAREQRIPEDRLEHPKVIDAVRVYFGGMAGIGGVEVTMLKENGQHLETKY